MSTDDEKQEEHRTARPLIADEIAPGPRFLDMSEEAMRRSQRDYAGLFEAIKAWAALPYSDPITDKGLP